jgi:hypothetical protein
MFRFVILNSGIAASSSVQTANCCLSDEQGNFGFAPIATPGCSRQWSREQREIYTVGSLYEMSVIFNIIFEHPVALICHSLIHFRL